MVGERDKWGSKEIAGNESGESGQVNGGDEGLKMGDGVGKVREWKQGRFKKKKRRRGRLLTYFVCTV